MTEEKVNLLTQVKPFPANPELHWQMKEPRAFVHRAFVSQGLVRHSSISKEKWNKEVKQ